MLQSSFVGITPRDSYWYHGFVNDNSITPTAVLITEGVWVAFGIANRVIKLGVKKKCGSRFNVLRYNLSGEVMYFILE